MGVDFDTHGLDWRQRVRRCKVFACLVTQTWQDDRLCQRQLAYARQLGKPIYFLVRPGASAPVQAGDHVVYCRTAADALHVLDEIMSGDR